MSSLICQCSIISPQEKFMSRREHHLPFILHALYSKPSNGKRSGHTSHCMAHLSSWDFLRCFSVCPQSVLSITRHLDWQTCGPYLDLINETYCFSGISGESSLQLEEQRLMRSTMLRAVDRCLTLVLLIRIL